MDLNRQKKSNSSLKEGKGPKSPANPAIMFVLRIQSVDFPDAAVAAVAADEVGTSSGGVTTSRPLSSHPPPSTTTSSILTLELPGANPVAPSRSPRILHTRGVIHLYHSSSSTSTSSSYASAVAATSSSSSGPATPQPASDSHLPVITLPRVLSYCLPCAYAICFLSPSRSYVAARASWCSPFRRAFRRRTLFASAAPTSSVQPTFVSSG